jgi:hypothetical protein
MIGIVEADAQELADRTDTWPEPHIAFNTRQEFRIQGSEANQLIRIEHKTCNVVDMPGKIPNSPFAVDEAWLFCAAGAEANEFHDLSLS